MKRSLNYCICYFLLSIGLLCWNSAGAESTENLLEELQTLRQEVEQRRAKLRQEVERQRTELQRELQLLKGALGAEDISGNTTESAPMPADTMSRVELESELRILQEEIEQVKEMLAAKQESAASPAALPFQLKGQVRTRLEWTDNDFNSGDANLVHFLRTRIGVAAQPHEHTGVFVQLQDARQWGEETNTLADGSGDNIDFHQAYIKIDQFLAPPLSLKLGRQEMVYGGQRLIGAVGWHNIGRAFDAVKLRYGAKSYVDIFNAKLAESGVKDRNFYGLYGHLAASSHSWEPYLLFEQDTNSAAANLKRATLGLYGKGMFTGASGHGFGFELESALQSGELGAQDVAAFMGTGALTYVSPHWRKHKFTLGLDFLSGDDDPTDADYKVFDTLFATNHKFYGFMDFFLNIPVHTGQGGLLDFMLKGEMKTAANTKLAVHLHHFALAEGQDKTLGQELDAIVTYKYNKAYSIQWGGLVFLPGDAMEAIKGGNDLAFKTYLQTLANF